MRVILAIALLFVVGSFIAAASKERYNYPRFFKQRTKLREIRGFKPEYISTAIGFGKREGPLERTLDLHGRERILFPFLKNFRGVPAEVLLQMLQTNPALADQVTMQNEQGDEESIIAIRSPTERSLIY